MSIGPHLLVTAILCPRCREPVLQVDRGGVGLFPINSTIDLADRVDLSAVPEKVDVTPHACPALKDALGAIASQARLDATSSGEVAHWARERDAGGPLGREEVPDGR